MNATEKLCDEENVDNESILNQKTGENDITISKHHRKRKKQYYNAIRNQMEFYFGDANLSRDRFLKKLITEDPFVPLSTFMTFNKIKVLTSSQEDIEKALYNSEFLELSGDKQRVRRITEIHPKENIDEYTVYVEALPPHSTHDTIRQQFKQFGPIAYVSLPKYRSGRIKEFAFIEFEQKKSVEKCLNTFRQFNCVINSHYQPEKMLSITSFLKEQTENIDETKNQDRKNTDHCQSDENKKVISTIDANSLSECVADISDVESITSQIPPVKRSRIINSNENDDTNPDNSGIVSINRTIDHSKIIKCCEIENLGTDDDDDDDDGQDDDNSTKPRQRKRRKNKNGNISSMNVNDHIIDNNEFDQMNNSINFLRVASKIEWKRLRNKYLTIQREQYAKLKKIYAQHSEPIKNNQKTSTLPALPRPVIIKNKQSQTTQICSRNINFYGANDGQNIEQTASVNENDTNEIETTQERPKKLQKKNSGSLADHLLKRPLFEYEPGLIVKVSFDGPCVDVNDFKAEIKQYSFVRYVDLKEGQTAAYVRVDTSHSAPLLIKHCAPRRCQILTGDIESDYWKKIARDREEKLSKNVKVPNRNRGRKLKNVFKSINTSKGSGAGKHVRFDD